MFYNNKMKFKERDASSKRKYSKISICKRQKLIDLVVHQGESLIKTTKKLNINLSTARLIIKLYKSTGEFYMKNFKHPPKEEQGQTLPKENTPPVVQDSVQDENQDEDVPLQQKEDNSAKEEGTEQGAVGECQFYWFYVPYYFTS